MRLGSRGRMAHSITCKRVGNQQTKRTFHTERFGDEYRIQWTHKVLYKFPVYFTLPYKLLTVN